VNDAPAGFEVPVTPSPAVRALRAGVIGLGVVGFALAAWLSRGRDDGWILLGLGALMLWAGWRHAGFGLSWGTLRVAADGRPAWRSDAGDGAGEFVAVGVERWYAGENLAWLRLRSGAGDRHEILVGRAGHDEETWRRLVAWLAWLRRGRQAAR
jgi:hypothetical protein